MRGHGARIAPDMLRTTALILCAMTACATALAAPQTVTASYDVRLNGLNVATVNERYEARDGTYRLASSSEPMGLFALVKKLAVRFTSTGEVTGTGLRPRQFEGRRATGEAPEVVAEFDWAGSRLALTHDGKTEALALPPGTQDRLSVMYQFMFVAPELTSQLAVAVTNGRRIDRYVYTVTPDVEQDTPLGRLRTVHLVRLREPGDPENEIWLAPEHGYVPVRMIIVERDGTRYEQLIAKLDLQP